MDKCPKCKGTRVIQAETFSGYFCRLCGHEMSARVLVIKPALSWKPIQSNPVYDYQETDNPQGPFGFVRYWGGRFQGAWLLKTPAPTDAFAVQYLVATDWDQARAVVEAELAKLKP